MREIKFRAWDIVIKEMYEDLHGFIYFDDEDEKDALYKPMIRLVNDTIDESFLYGRIILMQFTGLLDKNGKEIYEGDMIRYKYLPGKGFWNCDKMHIIKWGSTGFKMEPLPNKGGFNGWLCSLPGAYMPSCQELFEVIGNIYSNPELLEERE
jgi:hypothetical protein